jgi:hypothetical protein
VRGLAHHKNRRRCGIAVACPHCYSLLMELDAASLAIGRIEQALTRLERANLTIAGTAPTPRQGDLLQPAPSAANDALRNEVRAVIAELDKLIAEAGRG